MLIVIVVCLGLLLGMLAGSVDGLLLGGVLGVLGALLLRARTRLAKLAAQQGAMAQQLTALQQRLVALEAVPPTVAPGQPVSSGGSAEPQSSPRAAAPASPAPGERATTAPIAWEALPIAPRSAPAPSTAPGTSEITADNKASAPERRAARGAETGAGNTPTISAVKPAPPFKPALPLMSAERLGQVVSDMLLGGNTVVRAGILVLLVGIALLLKYAVDHVMFPLELRLAAVALAGLVLVAVGYPLRLKRPGFARTLQGGGVAVMYLVAFFSFRVYGLLPAGLALSLLVGIALFSAMLAVLQDAMALVVIGQLGGFMAPVLASTASDHHVALFSYYTLLNLVIVGIAYFKAWRPLNLIGFVFTFGVGSTWGALRYQPEHFLSTEPFLVGFFVMYLAIPVLFAWRRPSARGAWVDGTLVFGVPLATLALQHALVRDLPLGMAYSTLTLAVVYLGLAYVLYRQGPQTMRPLSEALLAIGVGFATLAVPYSIDNHHLTGATWALEGAGLYWVGVRQQRWLSRWAGVSLQLIGGCALLLETWGGAPAPWPFLNTGFLAAALVCVGSLFIARYAHYSRPRLGEQEASILQALIIWALLFWLGSGLAQLSSHVPAPWLYAARLIFFALSGLMLELVGSRCHWLPGRYPAALLLPLAAALLLLGQPSGGHLLSNGGWLGWSLYAAVLVLVLRRFVPAAPPWARLLHALWLWLLAAFMACESYALVTRIWLFDNNWGAAAAGASVAILLGLTVLFRGASCWPFKDYRDVYLTWGAGGLATALSLWLVAVNLLLPGSAEPLPYLPLCNPLDLAQMSALVALGAWYQACRRDHYSALADEVVAVLPGLIGALSLFWFNAMLARSVHHLAGVAFTWQSLWHSESLQVAFSLCWTLIGLVATVLASRHSLRGVWIVGATLLAVVVIKLFLVDLDTLDAVAKIGTFLVVGVLLLLVGYLAPVPPGQAAAVARPEQQ